MKTLHDIEFLEGVKVLVRVDFNVSFNDGSVSDDFRIRAALPTISFLREKGAKVILMSHLESNDGENPSLRSVATHLNTLGQPVTFIEDYKKIQNILDQEIQNGGCVLLENLRFFEGEKNNDEQFSKELASLADIYVNEAFPVSHREHASIVGVPKFVPSYAGLQFEKEVAHLSKAFTPVLPFLFILGGAKFDTKLPLLERFLKLADTIYIGGALANDALVAKGIVVGDSKVSNGYVDITNIVNDPHILLPVDAVIQDHSQKSIEEIAEHDKILDAGVRTLEILSEKIRQAKFILWNGPLGPFEIGFVEATEAVAKMIGEATQKGNGAVVSIVGGGDTLTAISQLGIEDQFTFVSSGGGAMLDFLAKGTLPGIEALK